MSLTCSSVWIYKDTCQSMLFFEQDVLDDGEWNVMWAAWQDWRTFQVDILVFHPFSQKSDRTTTSCHHTTSSFFLVTMKKVPLIKRSFSFKEPGFLCTALHWLENWLTSSVYAPLSRSFPHLGPLFLTTRVVYGIVRWLISLLEFPSPSLSLQIAPHE